MALEKQIYTLMDNADSKEKGFRLLMSEYQKDVYWHIRGFVKNHDDTNDVIQNTFVKIFRHFDKFQRNSSLYTWIYRIATNESLNHLKKSKRHKLDPIDDKYDVKDNDAHYMDGDEIQKKLQQVVDKLPEKQKAVFTLRYYKEMPYKKMAEVLETSEGALKASYHFAVKKIEAELKSMQ